MPHPNLRFICIQTEQLSTLPVTTAAQSDLPHRPYQLYPIATVPPSEPPIPSLPPPPGSPCPSPNPLLRFGLHLIDLLLHDKSGQHGDRPFLPFLGSRPPFTAQSKVQVRKLISRPPRLLIIRNWKGTLTLESLRHPSNQLIHTHRQRATLAKQQTRKPPTPEETDILKIKKSWEVALAPAKQLPMNAIMMYMSGNSLQIFSIMMVFMLFKNPLQSLLQTNQVFAKYETPRTRSKMWVVKAVYVLMNLVALALGIWKVNGMGLLP